VPPPATPAEVASLFPPGRPGPDLLLDGGACAGGAPSAILDLTEDPPRLVRRGALPLSRIESALGVKVRDDGGG
jgi:L-threonylcarbamoyladenylate synthase